MDKCGITHAQLIAWGGKETYQQAMAIVQAGDVTSVNYIASRHLCSGRICQPSGWEMEVSFTISADGRSIKSECPCRTNREFGQICAHTLAIGLALMILEMDDLPPSRPPTAQAQDSASTPLAPTEPNFIQVPATPTFYAYVVGATSAALSIEVDACYDHGRIQFPAGSTQAERVVWLADPEDPLVRRVRSLKIEREAGKQLEKLGFKPGYHTGDLKYYCTNHHRVLNFLGAGIPFLRRCGWHVELSPPTLKLTDTMFSILPVVSIRDAPQGAFEVSYNFEVGDSCISPVEVQAALNRGDGYLKKENQVFLLDNSAIEAMHQVFADCATTASGSADGWFRVPRIHAPYVRAALNDLCESVELDDSRAQNWRQKATQPTSSEAHFEPIALGTLERILRPYQKQGVYWLRFLETAGFCGLLADEMGLGKTLQTLTWLALPRLEGKGLPALIVCPTSLVRNWEAEAARFVPQLKTLVLSGPERAQNFQYMAHAQLIITSYALLQRDFDLAYADCKFSVVVLDEAQHIKNRQTRNAQAAKNLISVRRLVLTGTPIENSVADVWSIFDFLLPNYLGTYEAFKLTYENPIADGGTEGAACQLRLKRKLEPFILRRLKKSVAADLPDKLIKISYCPMPEHIQRDYNHALQRGRPNAKTKFEMLALLMKLRQIASRGKVDAFLEQLLEAIDGGHRVLVFSQFVQQLHVLREELARAEIPFCYLDGSTRDRLGECERFNQTPSIPVFLISLMAGGTGLNLTGADMVIHYDPWWNPAVEDQATDRAHRIGQKKQVYVVKLIAAGSIEEKVLALQRRKQAVIAATVSTTDTAIVERLTIEDLTELLAS